MTIRRFSALAEKHFNLLATDVGRPVGNLRHNLELPDLEALLRETIDTFKTQSAKRATRTAAGGCCASIPTWVSTIRWTALCWFSSTSTS